MPRYHNGSKLKAGKSPSKNTSGKFGRHSLPDDEDLEKSGFKGFRKLPTVVLQRIDLSPYIGSGKTGNIPLGNSETEPTVKATNLCLFQKCSVELVKSNLEKLRDEFLRHKLESPSVDPSETMQRLQSGSIACKICQKVYSNEKKLQNHQENKHMIIYRPKNAKPQKRVSFSDKVIVHELKEYHKCRKCTKIFEKYKALKKHMKQRHKKRKCYICNYCSKKFVDRMFFKVHIKLHCDVCSLLLPNKKSFIEHRRSVCRVLKLLKCKECDDTYFRFMDLKDHSYSHMDVSLVCDVCKDQFQSKCALAHHLAFLHSKRRPSSLYTIRNLGSERLYLCDFCEESSVEKEFIEKHLEILPDLSNRAMTGYKDYYFCDQCFKKFDTEKEMLQHKWTHFLKTEDQTEKPKGILLNSQPNDSYLNGIKMKYKLDEELPSHFKPVIVIERLNVVKSHIENAQSSKATSENAESTNTTEENVESTNTTKENAECNKTTKETNTEIPGSLLLKEILIDSESKKSKADAKSKKNNENKMEETENMLRELLEDGEIKKPIVDPKSKKTLISKYQCVHCGKYYSSNYCLNRHIETQHSGIENLQCDMCEETFVWPSLLKSHRCIRMNHPEMPFDDARPEIHFDNLDVIQPTFDDIPIEDDYIQAVDFEIPTPIVELREGDAPFEPCTVNNNASAFDVSKTMELQNLGYKVVMQEVPIEF